MPLAQSCMYVSTWPNGIMDQVAVRRMDIFEIGFSSLISEDTRLARAMIKCLGQRDHAWRAGADTTRPTAPHDVEA